MVCTWRMSSSRITQSESDNPSKGNLGIVEMSAEGGDGAASKLLGRIERSLHQQQRYSRRGQYNE